MRTEEVAEKVWQISQSGCKKAKNLDGDLQYVLQALENGWWAKERDASTKILAERR